MSSEWQLRRPAAAAARRGIAERHEGRALFSLAAPFSLVRPSGGKVNSSAAACSDICAESSC